MSRVGQVLARLDDAAYQAGVAQAAPHNCSASQALEAEYSAQLAQARRDAQRNQDLIGQNLVSHQSLEQSLTQQDALAAQLLSQRKQTELAVAGVRAAQVQLGYLHSARAFRRGDYRQGGAVG